MTNSQIFGPLRWFLLEVAKLLEGNALKFSDFEAEILEPDWGTTGPLKITVYVTGENSSILSFETPKSVNYLLRLVIIPALN